jgi:hypothetical protein
MHAGDGGDIAGMRLAAHREADDPKLHKRLDRGQLPRRVLAAGSGIGDDPNLVAARRLSACEVDDMPKKAADRGSQHMQNAQASISRLHGVSFAIELLLSHDC